MLVGEMFRENICFQIDSACLCMSKFRIQYQVCECNTSRWGSTVEVVMLETIFVLSFKKSSSVQLPLGRYSESYLQQLSVKVEVILKKCVGERLAVSRLPQSSGGVPVFGRWASPNRW